MPVSLTQLGKIYALTESPSAAEANSADETFRRLFFKWCEEQELPSNYGLIVFGPPEDFSSTLLDMAAPYVGARFETLSPLHCAAIGSLEACRWLDALKNYVTSKAEPGARHLTGANQTAYYAGVCLGVQDVLTDDVGPPRGVPTFAGVARKESLPMEASPASPEGDEPLARRRSRGSLGLRLQG